MRTKSRRTIVDIVSVLTDNDYQKSRNYWKWLKNKLKEEGSELVSDTNQLKMKSHDGKLRDNEQLESKIVKHHKIKNFGMVVTGSEVYNKIIDDKFSPVVENKLLKFGVTLVDKIYCDDDKKMIVNAM